jgi:hypothetical protein
MHEVELRAEKIQGAAETFGCFEKPAAVAYGLEQV